MIFKLRIEEVATNKRMSMTRLSRLADVNYKTVQSVYNDPYRDVAYSTLWKMARALGVSIDDLVIIEQED